MNYIRPITKILLLPVLCFLMFHMPLDSQAQLLAQEDIGETTTGIHPSHLQFNVEPGKAQSHKVTVSNNTGEMQLYHAVYQDFELSQDGQSRFMEAGSSEKSLSGLIRIEPHEFQVEPGETAEVTLTVTVPEGEARNQAAWGAVMIEQADELEASRDVTGAFTPHEGLSSTLAYSVWVYQTPPRTENSQVDITNFIVGNKARNKGVFLKVKNKGDGVSICNAYVEISNLVTGEMIIIEGKQYTILPGARRTLLFELDEELPKGSYSAVGVLDYNNMEELVETELEFKID